MISNRICKNRIEKLIKYEKDASISKTYIINGKERSRSFLVETNIKDVKEEPVCLIVTVYEVQKNNYTTTHSFLPYKDYLECIKKDNLREEIL